MNNPLRFIDPDGMVVTDFVDEEGKLLKHIEDGSQAKVTVANDKKEEFKKEASTLNTEVSVSAKNIGNPVAANAEIGEKISENKQTTVDLASKYQKEGQCLVYSTDKSGNVANILYSGNAPLYSVNQIGIRGTGAVGPGFTFSAGVTWDSKGGVGIYGSIGVAVGFDASIGLEYVNNASTNSSLNITDLNGAGAFTNGGILIMDHGTGGNANETNSIFTPTGNQYKTNSIGVSLSGPLGAGTRTFENMGILPIFK